MLGSMQHTPLLISSLIAHAAENHAATEIISKDQDGEIERSDWAHVGLRARKIANTLARLGVGSGDRVASLAWNRLPHLELYFGVTGAGVVLHTVNPRLFPEQIRYMIHHAEDSHVFVDPDLLSVAEKVAPELPEVKSWIVLAKRNQMPASTIPNLLCYEDLLAAESDDYTWPLIDENSASTLCYTSGTTGNPKGVLYSHRSALLHAFCAIAADGMALTAQDSVFLATPLYHVNAWGVPFAAAMAGSKLVLPGSALDGRSIYEFMRDERCTFSLGVPTVWLSFLDHVERNTGPEERKLFTLRRVLSGGAAVPRALVERFDQLLRVELIHAWGMTETSPLATVCRPLAKHEHLDEKARTDLRATQGRAVFGIELRIEDAEGVPIARDGRSTGELLVRGPWVASGYFKEESNQACRSDGWFATGDIARLDSDGFLQITDRSKDIIKSGGEWISSIELENAALDHPAVAEAAVIAVSHPRWQERPLLIIRINEEYELDAMTILSFLAERVARWWLPDDVVFVDELPHTATGKLLKSELRVRYRDHLLRANDRP